MISESLPLKRMASIPMLDLPRQQATLNGELERVVLDVIGKGHYISPEGVTPFEAKFAAFCGRKHVVGVNSGTAALQIALAALPVGPGDEVITVPNSFFATTEAIVLAGATPRFVDVDPETHLISLAALPGAITARTRAILPVHLFGNVVDVPEIKRLLRACGREDIAIVEDCAHATGARGGDQLVPLGGIGAFSFNPGKNIGAIGDAGAIVTDDGALAERARELRDHGRRGKNTHGVFGFNARLSLLNDRVLALKLDHLPRWNEQRRSHAAAYDAAFEANERVSPIQVPPGTLSARHQYVVRCRSRDALREHLRQQGIATAVHYPSLIVEQPPLARLGFASRSTPVALALNAQILSLPCFPELTPSEVAFIIEQVKQAP
jgi:dTDP-4-amino-4,6-dideoxygalactose transaminase